MTQNQGWGPPPSDPNGGNANGGNPYGQPHGGAPYGAPYGAPGGPGGWAGGWAPPPPRPGVIPLQPLGLGDVLAGAFSTFGRYWKQLVGVMLAVQGAGLLVVVGAVALGLGLVWEHLDGVFDLPAGATPADEDLVPVLWTLVPLGLLLCALMLLGWAVISSLVPNVLQEAVLGRRTTFGAMFRRSWSRLPAMLGTLLLTMVTAGLPWLVALVVGIVVAATADYSQPEPPGALLALPLIVLLALPLTVWLGVKFSLAPAVVVMEKLGPVAALRRSSRLVKDSWWRIFGITLLTLAIAAVIGYLIQLPFMLVGFFAMVPTAFAAADPDAGTGALVGGMVVYFLSILIGTVVSQVFQMGLPQLASGLLYVDQRIRREDLAPSLAAAAAAAPAQPPVPGGPPPGTF
ncbi:hypothetical protein [Streptomyces sp. NRRL S-87]|uniref:hypothetical protein n=1 Tax=Streptomyces sp. NRRL S-87 TaxID=1463920 RepID=UPI00068EB445|nr:hypothetical protein [Streptomyces sp. NRRL S-87]